MDASPKLTAAASRLCTSCGLCCNGVLFEIVKLQPTDPMKQLEKLGMQLSRRKRAPYFNQPCRFLKKCQCDIYALRPLRCRLFACLQLQRLADHETTEHEVRHMIDEVKGAVTIVENLLARCGNSDTEMALSERFLMAMSARLGDPAMTELHCDLVAKMNALNDLLNTNFRIEPVALRALAESV